MASLAEFTRRMAKRAKEIEEGATRVVRTVALAADQAVVLGTPVDTGRARSNWLASVGAPRRDTIEPYSPGSGLGTSEGGNAQGAIAQAVLATATLQPGQSVFIANNLPYIGALNDGSSLQAPAGFVEAAVQAGVLAASKARLMRD